jgi:hypothetical protein
VILIEPVCCECGAPGEVKPWHPMGDVSWQIVVCLNCGNAWLIETIGDE